MAGALCVNLGEQDYSSQLASGTRYLKPKGMNWGTFNALCDRIAELE
jgi:hypothetical protein